MVGAASSGFTWPTMHPKLKWRSTIYSTNGPNAVDTTYNGMSYFGQHQCGFRAKACSSYETDGFCIPLTRRHPQRQQFYVYSNWLAELAICLDTSGPYPQTTTVSLRRSIQGEMFWRENVYSHCRKWSRGKSFPQQSQTSSLSTTTCPYQNQTRCCTGPVPTSNRSTGPVPISNRSTKPVTASYYSNKSIASTHGHTNWPPCAISKTFDGLCSIVLRIFAGNFCSILFCSFIYHCLNSSSQPSFISFLAHTLKSYLLISIFLYFRYCLLYTSPSPRD